MEYIVYGVVGIMMLAFVVILYGTMAMAVIGILHLQEAERVPFLKRILVALAPVTLLVCIVIYVGRFLISGKF